MAKFHIVLIEWDGEKPPSTFYNRLHDLGVYVSRQPRKDSKEIGLPDAIEARRRIVNADQQEIGVVVQEGCVVASDSSLVSEIAMLAKIHGAKSVNIGTTTLDPFTPSRRATEIFNNIESVLGKTGRGSPPCDWSVTCSIELNTFLVKDSRNVIQCPSCGSPNILVRRGKPMRIKVDEKDKIVDAWARSRFPTSVIEMGGKTDEKIEPPPIDFIKDLADEKDYAFYELVTKSKRLVKFLEWMSVDITGIERAVLYLDGIYVNRMMHDRIERSNRRVDIAISIYERGGSPEDYPLLENELPDVLDAFSSALPPVEIGLDVSKFMKTKAFKYLKESEI